MIKQELFATIVLNIEEAIKKNGATEMKDMGKVMADINPKIKGKADSGEVSKLVKELLSTK